MAALKRLASAVLRGIGALRPAAARRIAGRGGRKGGAEHLDILTSVANRNHFQRHLEAMLRRAEGGYTLLAKCNISGLHDINTSFGYDTGDALLIQVGQRLCNLPAAAIGRLSGDEFAIALPLAEPDSLKAIIQQIRDLLAKKFILPGAVLDVRFSFGYVLGRTQEESVGLLRKAGIALHESKLSPFLDPIEFDRNAAVRFESRVRLTSDLQLALENGEFLMHYQPRVELSSGKIIGAEALLRWEHAIYGPQPPGRFIPIAEDSGLIVEIGAWAMRHVARFAADVNRGRPEPLIFSINVSQLQFRRHDLARLLRTILQQTGADPSWLILELTETLLADHSPAMIETLRDLRSLGVGLSVDDFGTGYSSLSRLDAFPVTEFKIDRSFVAEVDRSRSKHVIVDAMIRLGQELGLAVVAEGIETEAEASVLETLGCRFAQGYFFARPMPGDAFLGLIDGEVSAGQMDG